MKKVVNINLAGKQFTIDEDAYQALDKYLNTINKHFSSSSGFEDIMYDIEERIAELFEEEMQGSTIITVDKVTAMQKTMGTPQDFGAAADMNTSENRRIEKRFFRNTDNKVIAGVASGLGAYLGIENILLVRAVFLMIALSGIGILPYLILWIFIPEAKTASDKLSMRGEDININSIANAVEDGVCEIKETFSELHKNFKQNML